MGVAARGRNLGVCWTTNLMKAGNDPATEPMHLVAETIPEYLGAGATWPRLLVIQQRQVAAGHAHILLVAGAWLRIRRTGDATTHDARAAL